LKGLEIMGLLKIRRMNVPFEEDYTHAFPTCISQEELPRHEYFGGGDRGIWRGNNKTGDSPDKT
jgi:hypothetical protein